MKLLPSASESPSDSPNDSDGRRLGTLSLSGVVVFSVVCILAQFARHDLDWMRAPLSAYLRGDYGWVVKSAYFTLSAALAMLGLGYYRVQEAAARNVAPMVLFFTSGVALIITALADSGSRSGPHAMESLVHNLAAAVAFLCVTLGMLLQAWWFRADQAWRNRFTMAFTLAVVCFMLLWWYALWAEDHRALTQKALITLIVSWLTQASMWLRAFVPVVPLEGAPDRSPP